MAGQFKNRKFFLAYSSEFRTQSEWDEPIPNSAIDAKHPQVTPTVPSNQITREQTRDCSGEYVIFEELTSRLKRLRWGFYASAQTLAGWLALAYGAAADPTGTPAAEEQSLAISATGGTFTIAMNFEGLSDITSPIAWNATAAQIKAALESLRPIKVGNVNVTGAAGSFSIFGAGALANADLPLFTVNAGGLTGGTAEIAAVTDGEQRLHAISRSTEDQPPQTSMIFGFEGDETAPTKIKNVVVNSVRASASARGRVLVEVDIIGSGDLISAAGYIAPECENFRPIKAADCRLLIDEVYYSENLREFSFEYSNNILTGDDPFPFDDIDAVRLERGDRTSSMTFTLFGSKGDALYNLAAAEPQSEVVLAIGTKGNRVSVFAPSAKLRLADDEITFVGEANRSAMQITAEPFYDSEAAGSPDFIEAEISQSTALLLPA